MSSETKPKKPRTPKPPAPPKSVEELIAHALLTAATKPSAKWTAATAAGLFNTKEANHEAAIAECTKPGAELLKQEGKGGALTAAGFARVLERATSESAGTIAATYAESLDAARLERLIGQLNGRVQGPTAEQFGVAVRALQTVMQGRAEAEAARVQQAREDGYRFTLELRRKDVSRLTGEVARLRAEIAGLEVTLDQLAAAGAGEDDGGEWREKKPLPLVPTTTAERDFRRASAEQFANSWRIAFDEKRADALEFVEAAIWNIPGMKLGEKAGSRVKFDGRYHECAGPAFTGDSVVVQRPGWVLEEGNDRDYVALKARVAPA